jgi:hypothetical protein
MSGGPGEVPKEIPSGEMSEISQAIIKKADNMRNALHRSLAAMSSITDDLKKLEEHYQRKLQALK